MSTGFLRVQSYAEQRSAPIPEVSIRVVCDAFSMEFFTDAEGNAPDVALHTPDAIFSLEEENTTVLPYTTCDIYAYKEGYQPITILDSQIFADQTTLAPLELMPIDPTQPRTPPEETQIPVHSLFAGKSGSAPANALNAPSTTNTDNPGARVLAQVIIPTTVRVKLGTPTSTARVVSVPFRSYIANVASSEIYPTWPEEAIRANIYCQISCVLNRIYTEWYPSRGYDFDITSSPSYDQYYVNGRTIFESTERISNQIFDSFIRKIGTTSPYYASYCDGKLVSCSGLKQWGTVDLANAGRTALQILQNYYTNIEVTRTNNIQGIVESYPGTPLKQGSSGSAVSMLQRQLNRIAKDYPAFGTLSLDGLFGAGMAATVTRFQRQFNLSADGIVGRATWYQISYIYVSVTDLAELSSEGETGTDGALSAGVWGGTVLRVGSRGVAVEQVQFWLDYLEQFSDDLLAPSVDGVYGNGTASAVSRFQKKQGLVADGVVGKTTWDAIFELYTQYAGDMGSPNTYPGTALRLGARGTDVKQVQFWLSIAAQHYLALRPVAVDGSFGLLTEMAVQAFQKHFGLSTDGVVGRMTWETLFEIYLDITNDLLPENERPGQFPGTLRVGSKGAAVRELQYYLYLLSIYEALTPITEIDGSFGVVTEQSARSFQKFAGLYVDGIVGAQTWNALYQLVSPLRSIMGLI